MKIGVVGKGGVGKTSISSLLARVLTDAGHRVLAVDTDSNPNLGLSFGLDARAVDDLPAVPRSMVVGRRGDLTVAELLADYSRSTPAGVTLMSALRVDEAAAGCTCGGHATLRSLLGEALDEAADVTVVDMEAGIEHLSRSGGTLAHVDVLVVVVEPSRKAVITGQRTIALARDLGIGRFVVVANKVDAGDEAVVRQLCEQHGIPLDVVVPVSAELLDADRAGVALPTEVAAELWRAVDALGRTVEAAVELAPGA